MLAGLKNMGGAPTPPFTASVPLAEGTALETGIGMEGGFGRALTRFVDSIGAEGAEVTAPDSLKTST
jgi:hypothetical protein